MNKRKVIFGIVFLITAISAWYIYKFIAFKSDRDWITQSVEAAPAEVVDTLEKHRINKGGETFTILDPSYKGKVSLSYSNNHFILFSYDLFIIKYMDKSVTLKKEIYNPPYVFYKGKMYCADGVLFSKDSLRRVRYIDLE